MKFFTYILTATLVLLSAIAVSMCTKDDTETHTIIVQTTRGKIRGYEKDSVLVFKGIPYARAARYKRPQSTASWDTIMDCTEYGDVALQTNLLSSSPYNPMDTMRTMSEDCLNLNIWTSVRKDENLRPVMVWLHGGGFNYGSAHQNRTIEGSYLADKETVVVVTLNHRIGVFGFLDLSSYGEEYKHTGNLGMLDIVSALWWLRDNVSTFGGDPNNITLFGEGAGGVKVLTLLAMPIAKGLFHKAIVQSGMLEGMNQQLKYSQQVGIRTIKEAGVEGPEDLKTLSFDSIDAAAERAIQQLRNESNLPKMDKIRLAPVAGTQLLPQPIYSDSAIFASADIPIVIGSNLSDIVDFDKNPNMATIERENVHHLSNSEIDRRMKEKYGDLSNKVKQEFAFAHPDRSPGEALTVDTQVRSLVMRMAHLLARRGNAPVYVYLFTWTSPLHDGYALSFRSSEIPFVFGNYEMADFSRAGGNEARRLSRIMARCWASFARSGNPNNSITPFWRRINLGEGRTLIFDSDVHLEGYNDLPLIRLFHKETVKDIEIATQYR